MTVDEKIMPGDLIFFEAGKNFNDSTWALVGIWLGSNPNAAGYKYLGTDNELYSVLDPDWFSVISRATGAEE